jgi:hypothetical protein
MTKQVRHLVDEAWDAVPISATGGRFLVKCGQVVGIEAVIGIAQRPVCLDCLIAAGTFTAVLS